MKKKTIIFTVLAVIGTVCVIAVLYALWYNGAFLSESSATVWTEGMTINGRKYIPVSGSHYTTGRTIAKDSSWRVREIQGDPAHTFLEARSFLDQYLFVREDYVIPESGTLTKAHWKMQEITDPAFLQAIAEINAAKTTTYTFDTESISRRTDRQDLKRIYLAYENCPVATVFAGYMGTVDGKWVITTNEVVKGHVECYEIPAEYVIILEQY